MPRWGLKKGDVRHAKRTTGDQKIADQDRVTGPVAAEKTKKREKNETAFAADEGRAAQEPGKNIVKRTIPLPRGLPRLNWAPRRCNGKSGRETDYRSARKRKKTSSNRWKCKSKRSLWSQKERCFAAKTLRPRLLTASPFIFVSKGCKGFVKLVVPAASVG